MSFIDPSYFQGELIVPNKNDTVLGVYSNLSYFIGKYESIYLKKLLGTTLYNNLIAGLAATTPVQQWIDLKNQIVDSTNKVSGIANFVWIKYTENQVGEFAGTGHQLSISENSQPLSIIDKRVRAWNEMVYYNRAVYDFISNQTDQSLYGVLPYSLPIYAYTTSYNYYDWLGYYWGSNTDCIPDIQLKINSLGL